MTGVGRCMFMTLLLCLFDAVEQKVIVTYETQEQAQRAAAELGSGHEHMPRVR